MSTKQSTVAAIQAVIAETQAIAGGPPPPPPPPSGSLSVALDFGSGSVARFTQATAADRGEYVGEHVRQKCFLSVDAAFPDWRVYFRPDTDGLRDEVVVEYGRTKAGSLATLGYTATITRASATVYTVTVPKHYGYGRWRWQSSERPVVRTPAALIARKWLPNFGTIGLYGKPASGNSDSWSGPFSAPAGFNPSMTDTGGGPQIGHLTTYAAEYVLYGTAAALRGLRTEGEWMGNWCIHARDDVTGAPLDVRGQSLSFKGDGGTINDYPALSLTGDPGSVVVDSAHRYSCPNLPWLLTDDPFLLEELQFGCNRHVLDGQYHRFAQNLQGLVYPGQTRSYAWAMRDMFLVALTTPAVVPSWLRPRSYWQACVDDNKTYALKFVNAPARVHALFRAWPISNREATWQSTYLNAAVGVAVSTGFTDWLPIFAWGVDKHIQQTNGTSGWPRQWPVPYYSIPNRAAQWDTPTGLLSPSSDATTCTSWADYWAFYKSGSPDPQGVGRTDTSGATINDTGWDALTIRQNPTSAAYFLQLRTALALAVTHSIPGAQASYNYIDERLRNQLLPQYSGQGLAPYSIDPVSGGSPPPPPVGAPTISNLTATPQSLPAGGGNVVVNATVNNATAVTLDGAPVTLPTTKSVTASRSLVLVATGATAPPATASVAVTVAATQPPPPSGEVLAVNSTQRYQTMRGWEATAIGWATNKATNAYDPTFAQQAPGIITRLANELGINRLHIPVRSGWMNTVDYWPQFVAGSITYPQLGAQWYKSMNGAPTQYGEFDWTVNTIIKPMRTAMQARGESLIVSLCFTDFGGATGKTIDLATNPSAYASFMKKFVDRLTASGIATDAIDVVLEPENSGNWMNGGNIGRAMVALRAAVGPNIKFVAPSCTNAQNTINPICTAIEAVPGALATLDVVGYHRYLGASYTAIAAWAQARGKETGMTEWFNGTIDTVLDDLTQGQVSVWQKWSVAGKVGVGSNPQAHYYLFDGSTVNLAPNTAPMALLFLYVRLGARRIGCTSQMYAVAFENITGKQVVFAKRTATAATVTITGLRPGVYGVRSMATGSTTASNGADVTADANGRAIVAFAPGYTTIYGK